MEFHEAIEHVGRHMDERMREAVLVLINRERERALDKFKQYVDPRSLPYYQGAFNTCDTLYRLIDRSKLSLKQLAEDVVRKTRGEPSQWGIYPATEPLK